MLWFYRTRAVVRYFPIRTVTEYVIPGCSHLVRRRHSGNESKSSLKRISMWTARRASNTTLSVLTNSSQDLPESENREFL